jgi:hypothetical protein
MRRLVVLATLFIVFAITQVASAHHTASGSAKRAVLQSLVRNSVPFRSVNNAHDCQTLAIPCWRVVVSANSWAASNDVGPGNNGAGEFRCISHLVDGRWRYVGGWGEGIGLACKRDRIPANVSRDLGTYCS